MGIIVATVTGVLLLASPPCSTRTCRCGPYDRPPTGRGHR